MFTSVLLHLLGLRLFPVNLGSLLYEFNFFLFSSRSENRK